MLRKKQVITMVSIAVISFLIGTTFNVMTMATDGGNPFDLIWEAINDLQSETSELWVHLAELRTDYEDLTVEFEELTNDFIELKTDYEEFKSNVTIALSRTPDYDSGWVQLRGGTDNIFTHNLNTVDVFIYIIGSDVITGTNAFQKYYGGFAGDGGSPSQGIYWYELTPTDVNVHRYGTDSLWQYVRVMIWKIQD